MAVLIDGDSGGEALIVGVDLQRSCSAIQRVLLDEDNMIHTNNL